MGGSFRGDYPVGDFSIGGYSIGGCFRRDNPMRGHILRAPEVILQKVIL